MCNTAEMWPRDFGLDTVQAGTLFWTRDLVLFDQHHSIQFGDRQDRLPNGDVL